MFNLGGMPLLAALCAFGGIFNFAEAVDAETSTLPESGVPDATAFFPLNASTSAGDAIVSRSGQQILKGNVINTARWVADDVFGYVLDCSAEQQNSIILDPIPIGSQGPFAVNLWFKTNTSANTGGNYSYVLSALAQATPSVSAGNDVYIRNSLQLMLPQALNNRSGLVRAIVKDSNDPNIIVSTLDSDGNYNAGTLKPVKSDFKNISDGAWHMVTVTTHTDVPHGFLLYVDGQMAGQHKTGVSNLAYGGDPIFLNGSMYLCARADGDVTRFFSGSVAQASFYNEALNASSVMALYSSINASTVPKPGEVPADAANETSSVSNVTTIKGTSCVFPFIYQDANYSTCMSPQGSGSRYCRDTNGAFLLCATASPDAVPAVVNGDSPVSSPVIAGAVPVDPASNAATDARANVDSSSAAGQGHGLSKGTIAGIVLGSIAAAALLTTLIAFIVIKTMGPGGHKRLQEAPSSKFLVHNSAMDRQVEMTKTSDAKDAQNGLFHGPQSSTDFNIRASS